MANGIGKVSKEFSGCEGPNEREEKAPELLGRQEGKLRRKLFHREERPALERDIIDTSEWTCANYRYVPGQHFGL